jgi:hypothetical protein
MDEAGNLFGVALIGGVRYSNCYYPPNEPPSTASCGRVFELTPNADRTSWTEKTVYRFCEGGLNCSDGAGPSGGLIFGAAGQLYSVTIWGGAHGTPSASGGTVFELTPNSALLARRHGATRSCIVFARKAARVALMATALTTF